MEDAATALDHYPANDRDSFPVRELLEDVIIATAPDERRRPSAAAASGGGGTRTFHRPALEASFEATAAAVPSSVARPAVAAYDCHITLASLTEGGDTIMTTATAATTTATRTRSELTKPSGDAVAPPSSLPSSRIAAAATTNPARETTNTTTTPSSDYYQAMELEDGQEEIPSSPPGPLSAVLGWLNSSRSFSPRHAFRNNNNSSSNNNNNNNNNNDGLMKEERPIKGPIDKWIRILSTTACSPLAIYALMFVCMAAGLLYGAIKQYDLINAIDWDEQLWVAFAGSSYLFVNDIPRLMEVISDGQVVQDSCLHAGGSLAALVMTGNGMYYRWRTNEALIQVNDDEFAKIYDYGACSVHMLIAGYDKYIEYGNKNKAYYNDGSNPCLVDQYYIQYVTNKYSSYPPKWDYVVLADQSKRIASVEARNDTIDALISVYAPLLIKAGAVPLIVDTHAFWSGSGNMTGLSDIPTFTELIYDGVVAYADALSEVLPAEQAPVIVPVGLAYLTVWEENITAWKTLFLSDQVHASFHGSYFFAVILYTALFGHLPQKQVAIPEHMEYLFGYSRKNLGGNSYPSDEEAQYLLNVAKRVVLNGHVPSSFGASTRR